MMTVPEEWLTNPIVYVEASTFDTRVFAQIRRVASLSAWLKDHRGSSKRSKRKAKELAKRRAWLKTWGETHR